MKDSRPGWHRYFLDLAEMVAARADCSRRQVGAVLVLADRSVVGTGYNGGPSGGPSCLKGQCPRGVSDVGSYDSDNPASYDVGPGACIALHAEQNVLMRGSWAEMQGSTLYVTCEPCPTCWRLIKGTPVACVVWPEGADYVVANRGTEETHKFFTQFDARTRT